MVHSLSYRPPKLLISTGPLPDDESVLGGFQRGRSSIPSVPGVPEGLSFDRVINGLTFKPCTVRDFMNYLIYVEHAAENLQFFLWFQYYEKRFSQLPANEKSLSQPWTAEKSDLASPTARTFPPLSPTARAFPPLSPVTPRVFDRRNSADSDAPFKKANPFNVYTRSLDGDDDSSMDRSLTQQEIKESANVAYENANVMLQPFTIQPFREEITRVIATYIAEDAPRQLNLGGRQRNALLQALSHTTHPSAFEDIVNTVEFSLRRQAHPNFIRWTIGNCNPARLRFCGTLGSTLLVGGLACLIILTLSSANRPWRLISLFPMTLGVAMLFCVYNGVCLVLHLLHHHHLRPWELFVDSTAQSMDDMEHQSMKSFGSRNSYEDEPWIGRYHKRNLIRKIFDREVWIRDGALRRIHDTIFIQALLIGLSVSCILVGAFCAAPQLNVF